MKEYIAYKTVDSERDSWCEKSFLFESESEVLNFFTTENPDFVNIFTEEDNREIRDFKTHTFGDGPFDAVEFETEYAGRVTIHQMNKGFLIVPKPVLVYEGTAVNLGPEAQNHRIEVYRI